MKMKSFYIKVLAITLTLSMLPVKASASEDDEHAKNRPSAGPMVTQLIKDSVLGQTTQRVRVGKKIYVQITSLTDLLGDVDTLANQEDTAFYPLTQARFNQVYSGHCKVYAGHKETVTWEEKKDLTLLFVTTESLLRWQGLGCIQRVDQGEYEENSYVYQPAELGRIMAAFSQENIERLRLETPPSKNSRTFMEAAKQIVFLEGEALDETSQQELPLSFFLTQGVMMSYSLISLLE
ncbi:MAG: hypothetical protein ACK50V_02840 [Alphaproteobacteria bacterium]|jgi:hypothetical protein